MKMPINALLLSSIGNFFTENLPRLGTLGMVRYIYIKVATATTPIDRNVMRHPNARPIMRPMGMPNTMAMAAPEPTMPIATARWRSLTMRAAMGETMLQNTEWEKATPIRAAMSM